LVHCPLAHLEAQQQLHVDELQTLLLENANVHSTHRELRETVTTLDSQIAAVRRRIPNEPLEATFLSDATSIAQEEELLIDNFRRLSIERLPEYSEVDVVISGRGSYAGICRFIDRVSQLARLSTVRRCSIKTDVSATSYPFEVVYSLQFAMQSAKQPAAEGASP
jgi:Tfp pilus assembly protein PilO